jgi:uncharacterized protein (DUF2384 family)
MAALRGLPWRLNPLAYALGLMQAVRKALAPDAVAAWFRTPNPVLADLRPLDLLASRTGQSRVKALLGKIRWGIPA